MLQVCNRDGIDNAD